MGLGRGLVKRVFSKSKSSIGNIHHERSFGLDKSRWASVRLYLCGDELNSVLVENDSASIKSSEANVIQPLAKDSGDEESCNVAKETEYEEFVSNGEDNPLSKFSHEEPAILIQSAFRGYMARRRYVDFRKCEKIDGKEVEDQSGVNEAASIEVLADESIDNFSLRDENGAIQHRVMHKSRSQVYRLKEEWDDSTLSSDTVRLRFQNKLEATSRRERALAYAFSQQLRKCTTKKKAAWSEPTTEPNTGWTWLERWMATRVPEKETIIYNDQRSTPMIAKERLDLSVEESCGSNDVPVTFEGSKLDYAPDDRIKYGKVKSMFKAPRIVSRRKTMSEYHRPLESTKVNKKVPSRDQEEKRYKQVQPKCTGETKSNDAA